MAAVNPDRGVPTFDRGYDVGPRRTLSDIYNRNKKPTISSMMMIIIKKKRMKWDDWIQSHGLICISAAATGHGRVVVGVVLTARVELKPNLFRFSLEPIKWHSPSPSAQVGPELWKRWARPWLKARVVKSGWRFPNDFFCCRQGRNALLAAFHEAAAAAASGVWRRDRSSASGNAHDFRDRNKRLFSTDARRRRRIATRTAFTE